MSNYQDWQKRDDLAAVILAILFGLVILAFTVWRNWGNHCVETREEACGFTHCVDHDAEGGCTSWRSGSYPCEQCVRWERRSQDAEATP